MKRKEAIEYLNKLSIELSDMASESKDNVDIITGLAIGVTHARMVLEGTAGELDTRDEADAMVFFAMLLKEVLF